MISTIDIEINAANPSLPLTPFKAFVNSPSSIRVRNVPRKVGKWEVTKVFISANYPDNSIKTAECVLTGGVWVGTIAGCSSVGRSVNGYQITANGTDENGAAVTGYCLGVGDVQILSRDATITIGETTYYVHILDAQPQTPHKGDLCKIAGTWKIYNGTAWDTLGGGGGGNITDVKVNGVSVVDSEGVALIDISGKADATALTAEVNRAQAAEALKADQTALTAEVNRATAAEATKASAASLTAEVNRATAAEALKRDKTDMTIPMGDWVVTGSQRPDQSKWVLEWHEDWEPSGWWIFYDGEQVDLGRGSSEQDTSVIFYDNGDACTATRTAADTIAKTSEVNAGLATKLQNPTSETAADNGKYLKKNANGTEWATVQSGPSIVTSFPATPLDTDVPSTKLVKDSLDAKFDKAGGTISGDVEISADPEEGEESRGAGSLRIGGEVNGDGSLTLSANGTLQVGEFKGTVIIGGPSETEDPSVLKIGGNRGEFGEYEDNDYLTITHNGSGSETLTQRIVRDFSGASAWTASTQYTAGISWVLNNHSLYVCKVSHTSSSAFDSTKWTAMPNVSSLFSGANTSLVNTIRYEIAANSASVVEGETVMVDRTINKATMTADVNLAFPTKPSGKARDFLLVLTATTASQLGLPTGVTTSGDTFSFTAGKTYLIAFTEIGVKAVSDVNKDWFYVRSIEL